METLLGFIAMFGFNFPPRGWALCNGQLLSVAQNQALFALLGNYYGGNGINNFALPDLRGRIPIHIGGGIGTSQYTIGQIGGAETANLLVSNLPNHTHRINAVSETGDTELPADAYLANTGPLDYEYKTSGTRVSMNAAMISGGGNNLPVSNMQPYLVLNFCIALQGVFPSRN